MEEINRYQIKRWRDAVEADARGKRVVLDGDPFKLYYSWLRGDSASSRMFRDSGPPGPPPHSPVAIRKCADS